MKERQASGEHVNWWYRGSAAICALSAVSLLTIAENVGNVAFAGGLLFIGKFLWDKSEYASNA